MPIPESCRALTVHEDEVGLSEALPVAERDTRESRHDRDPLDN